MSDGFGDLRVRAEYQGLFETSVLHGHVQGHEAMTAALVTAIRARQAADRGLKRSNVGGWHSATDMLQWGGPAAAALADSATKMAKRLSSFDGRDANAVKWTMRMWANISPPGALNMSHAHPGVLWAAVYYCSMGVAAGEEAGALILEDPRFPLPQARMPGFRIIGADGQPQGHERKLATKAGDLVLFPAWLRHGVSPHEGSGERISVAMNIDVAGN